MPDVQSTLHASEKPKRKAKTLKKRKAKTGKVYQEYPLQTPRLKTRNETENDQCGLFFIHSGPFSPTEKDIINPNTTDRG